MTIIFKKHFQEIFRWNNCNYIPRIGDGIDFLTSAFVVTSVTWRSSTEIHISLEQLQ